MTVLGLAILSTALAYLLYFRLIASAGPTNATSVTFLIPFFSGVWGNLFLGEVLEPTSIMGFGVILIGLVLVTGISLGIRLPKRQATRI
jgi:drug/metabolite transporter (DMT)-like permease